VSRSACCHNPTGYSGALGDGLDPIHNQWLIECACETITVVAGRRTERLF